MHRNPPAFTRHCCILIWSCSLPLMRVKYKNKNIKKNNIEALWMYLIVILIMIIIKINETHYMECLTSAWDLLNVSIWKIAQRNGGGPSEKIWKVIGQNFCLTLKWANQICSLVPLKLPRNRQICGVSFYASEVRFYLFSTDYVNTNCPWSSWSFRLESRRNLYNPEFMFQNMATRWWVKAVHHVV